MEKPLLMMCLVSRLTQTYPRELMFQKKMQIDFAKRCNPRGLVRICGNTGS